MLANVIIFSKYLVCGAIIIGVWLFPAWLARQNKKDKNEMGLVRLSSWLFGWTGFGWIYGLWLAAR